MPFTIVWDEAYPAGTDPSAGIDTYIQEDKEATRERLESFMGISDFATRYPMSADALKMNGAADTKILGGTNSFNIYDSTGATPHFTINNATGTITGVSGLEITGDFKVNTNKFVVTASSGDTSVAGTLSVTGTAGIGVAAATSVGMFLQKSSTGPSTVFGFASYPTLIAGNNNVHLKANALQPTFTPSTYTGLTATNLLLGAWSVAGFISPADPTQIDVGIITGTGATNAYALKLGAPTGATNNYLISDSAGTAFQVMSSGNVGLGASALSYVALRFGTSVTASGAAARMISIGGTLVAAANNDILTSIMVSPSRTAGSYTGLQSIGLTLNGFSVAAYTSPADPIQLNIAAITGTGATNAYAIQIAPPTGATNNYLISTSTANVYNVTSTGSTYGLTYTASGTNTTNLIPNAPSFSGWTAYNCSITSTTEVAPDGSLTGSIISGGATDANINLAFGAFSVAGSTKEFAVYVKEGTLGQNQINVWDATTSGWLAIVNVIWDAVAPGGTPGLTVSAGTVTNLKVAKCANNWYRCSFTVGGITIGHNHQVNIYSNHTGSGSAGTVYVWRAEAFDAATSTAQTGLNVLGTSYLGGDVYLGGSITHWGTTNHLNTITTNSTYTATTGANSSYDAIAIRNTTDGANAAARITLGNYTTVAHGYLGVYAPVHARSNQFWVATTGAYSLVLGTNNTAAITINSVGNVGSGGVPVADAALNISNVLTTSAGNSNEGLSINATMSTGATSFGASIYSQLKTAASGTITAGYGYYIDAPTVSNTAITTINGIYIVNQGQAKSTNAYGIYIAAQSGAITTNIGLYNGGTTQLQSNVAIGGATNTATGFKVTGALTTSAYQYGSYFNSTVSGATNSATVFIDGVPSTSGTIADYAVLWVGNTDAIVGGGTITRQYGVYVAAPTRGATNYAIYTTGGLHYFGGQIGIGATPLANMGVYASNSTMTGTSQIGIRLDPVFSTASTVSAFGMYVTPNTAANLATGIVYGISISNVSKGALSTVTTQYGLYVENMVAASTNYAIYTGTGKVRFGDTLTVSTGTSTSGTMPIYIPAGTLVTDVSAGNDVGGIEFAGHTFYGTQYKVRRSFHMDHQIVTADTTVSGTTSPTTVFTSVQAADYLTAGKKLVIRLQGIFTTGGTGRTFTIELKQGATVLSTVTSPSVNVTNAAFEYVFTMTVRTIGAGGTSICYARFSADTTTASTASTGTASINTTIDNTLTAVVTWSTTTGTSMTVQQGHTETLG